MKASTVQASNTYELPCSPDRATLCPQSVLQATFDTLLEVQEAAADGSTASHIIWTKALHVRTPKGAAPPASVKDRNGDVQTVYLELPMCCSGYASAKASASKDKHVDRVAPSLTVATLMHGAGRTLQHGTIRVSEGATLQLEGKLLFVNTTFVGAAQ